MGYILMELMYRDSEGYLLEDLILTKISIFQAIKLLPPLHKEAIRLRLLGMTIDDMMRFLEISRQGVFYRLRMGWRGIKEILEGEI